MPNIYFTYNHNHGCVGIGYDIDKLISDNLTKAIQRNGRFGRFYNHFPLLTTARSISSLESSFTWILGCERPGCV